MKKRLVGPFKPARITLLLTTMVLSLLPVMQSELSRFTQLRIFHFYISCRLKTLSSISHLVQIRGDFMTYEVLMGMCGSPTPSSA